MLKHALQGDADACMYHATYALTHDEQWLSYARDGPGDPMDDVLWLSRLRAHGLLLFTHHQTQAAYSAPAGAEFWTWFRECMHDLQPGQLPLLVTTWGNGLYHMVGVLLDTATGDVTISNSAEQGIQLTTWAQFLESRYARAYGVQMLCADPHDSAG